MRLSLERTLMQAAVVPLAAAVPGEAFWRVLPVAPGSKEHVRNDKGFCGNLGDPVISTDHRRRSDGRLAPTSRPCGGVPAAAWERSSGTTVVPPSEGIRSAAGGMAGSLSVRIVPMKPGQSPSMATRRREGGRLNMEPFLGTTTNASEFGHRIHETGTDSNAGEAIATGDGLHVPGVFDGLAMAA